MPLITQYEIPSFPLKSLANRGVEKTARKLKFRMEEKMTDTPNTEQAGSF